MAKKSEPTTQPTTQDHSHDSHNHAQQNRHPEIGENKQIEFTVDSKTIDEAYQKVIRKYQPHVKSDGFRKGKAPISVVESMVGQQRLYQEVAESVVPGAYFKAIQEAKLAPIADPDIHIEKMDPGQDWKFHAHIAEKPSLKLGKYKETVKKAVKEHQEKILNQVQDDKIKVASDKQQGEDAAKAEDEKAPTPEQVRDQKLDAILGALRAELKPIIPELLVRQETTRQIQQLEKYLKAYQISPESYFKSTGKTGDQLQQEYSAQALATWQIEMILDAVAEEENITVPEEEVTDTLAKNAKNTEAKFTESDRKYTQSLLKKKKVFDFLVELEK